MKKKNNNSTSISPDFIPRNRNTIKPTKRILSCLADLVLFMVVLITIFTVAVVPFIKAVTPYNTWYDEEINAQETCQQMIYDSHLNDSDDNGDPLNWDTYMLQTYFTNDSNKSNNPESDIFLEFYISYASNNVNFTYDKSEVSFSIKDVNELLYDVNKTYNDITLWQLGVDSSSNPSIDVPVTFVPEVQAQIQKYIDKYYTDESSKAYAAFYSWAKESMDTASSYLANSDQYVYFFNIMDERSSGIMYIFSYASLISFTVLFALYYFIVPLCFKNGQTLGKRVLKLGVYNLDKTSSPVSIKKLILRTLLQYVTYFFMIMFVPYFQLGLNAIYLPLFPLGNITFNLIFVAAFSIVVSLASLIYMCTSFRNQALHDKFTNVIVIDPYAPVVDEDLKPDVAKQFAFIDDKKGNNNGTSKKD